MSLNYSDPTGIARCHKCIMQMGCSDARRHDPDAPETVGLKTTGRRLTLGEESYGLGAALEWCPTRLSLRVDWEQLAANTATSKAEKSVISFQPAK